jgi:hypothetical protein
LGAVPALALRAWVPSRRWRFGLVILFAAWVIRMPARGGAPSNTSTAPATMAKNPAARRTSFGKMFIGVKL